jgi:hypothetical protein
MTLQAAHLSLAQAKEIARSVHAIRRDWDRPGIEDALGRARFLADAASVAIAAHRAAADPANRTPAVIALDGPHWRDAVKPPHFAPPTPAQRCGTCSEREDVCRSRWADDHDFAPDLHRPSTTPPTSAATSRVEGLRAIRDNRLADLCAHHVPPANCVECRKRTPDSSPAPDVVSEPAVDDAAPGLVTPAPDVQWRAGEDRPESACLTPACYRPTTDGICDRCRAAAAAEDVRAGNAELIERLRANEAERARTRPPADPGPPRYFTSADYDPERVHAAQARAAADRSTR